mmetsp:Transcript_31254/g.50492  ORF Transcript_31254/g.50492 Transcript_31254/m.50492 type:complete len:337 (-) Transcript_31254:177-1187(-)|eukprot:CAMPEP_0184644158 /NCGR_PEP_ID=MMETSP0308-20130426/921_1 /TAXON_ID=38269 /ORGANISM="Gloeochaete witrockiana, Strain SAG 46.84" /LENGTH=336 /DNA_ID=CAMNT_0027072533 /DNA_START=121 /DNA_END=1131 /DNA_ORIENTATION=+
MSVAEGDSFGDKVRVFLLGPGAARVNRAPGYELLFFNRDDFIQILVTSLVLVLVRAVFENVLNQGVAQSLGFRTRGLFNKFKESLWYSISYNLLFAGGIYIQLKEPDWAFSVTYYFKGYPKHELSAVMKNYYLTYLAFYVSTFVYLFLVKRRKDFIVMFVHHTATCAIILVSHALKLFRVGVVIMSLHDLGDIFLYTAKVFYYLRKGAIAETIFVGFAIAFFISRIIFFPRVIYSCAIELTSVIQDANPHHYLRYWTSNGMLIVLQALHVYWFWLILKMVAKAFQSKNLAQKDIRSSSEEDEPYKARVEQTSASSTATANGRETGSPSRRRPRKAD